MKIEINCNSADVMKIVTDLCITLGVDEYTHNISDRTIRLDVGDQYAKKEVAKPQLPEKPKSSIKEVSQPTSLVRACKHGGKKFTAKRANQAYCSQRCKRRASWKRECAKVQAEDDGCGRGSVTPTPKPSFKTSFEKSLKVKKCAVCGKEFKQKCPRQMYCSDECKKAARRVGSTTPITTSVKPPVIKPTPQPVVAKPIVDPNVPTVKKICEVCEFPFETQNANQRFCNKCYNSLGIVECVAIVNEKKQNEKMLEEARRIKFKVCPKCGKNFTAKDPEKEFFCPECTEQMTRQRNKR